MQVEVCYASEEKQFLAQVNVSETATVKQAIDTSKVLEKFPEIDLEKAKVGIFSRFAKLDQQLRSGDRVEIYRPLKIDPKAARRLRAKSKSNA